MFDYNQITEVPKTYEDIRKYTFDIETTRVLRDLFNIPMPIIADFANYAMPIIRRVWKDRDWQ